MSRGKGGGDDWGKFLAVLLGVGAGAVVLYYLTAGREEKDAALIPDRLEDQIDLVVKYLNERYDHRWVNLALDALEAYIRMVLPREIVRLVNVVYGVEQLAERMPMDGPTKQRTAVDWARRGITGI